MRFYKKFNNLAKSFPPYLKVPVLHPLKGEVIGFVHDNKFYPFFSESIYQTSLVRNAITNYDGIILARGAGRDNDPFFAKTASFGGVSGVWYSSFRIAGLPPTISPSNIPGGSVMTRASAGAIPLLNPTGGNKKYLLTAGVSVASVSGFSALLLVDLLVAAANINANTTDSQTVNTAALTRYTTGEGVMMTLCVTTTLGGSAANVTIGYTNQAGTSGRSTGAIAMTTSAGTSRLQPSVANAPFIILQSGDTGVRSVQTVEFSAAMGAGVCDIYLFKPLAIIPTVAANTFIERDSTIQIDGLTELVTGTDGQIGCLGFFALTGGSTTTTFTGLLRTTDG